MTQNEIIRQRFPHERTQGIADDLGLSYSQVASRAFTMGLRKTSIKEITPAQMCIFKNEKCPIISKHLNYYTIFHNEQEIKVTSTQIEIL